MAGVLVLGPGSLIEVQKDGIAGVDGLDGARGVAVSPNGRHVYVTGRTDSAVAVFQRVEAPVVPLAAVLPASRSVQVGDTASAFGAIINPGAGTAIGCSIAAATTVSADFSYQTTDPVTNALIGSPDTPADILANGLQSFVFSFTPTAAFAPTEVELDFDCLNTLPAPSTVGLNTLLLSASDDPVPDIVALGASGIFSSPSTLP